MCFLLGGKGKLLQAEEEKAREKNTRQESQNRIPGYLVFIAKQKNGNKTHKNSILP